MFRKFVPFIAAFALAAPASAAAPDRVGDALDIYRTVIGFRTSAGHGKVPEMANYLAGKLRAAGFSDADIDIAPLGETASMTVRYRGDGSSGKAPIVFLAHMDVVDARPEDWVRDPFTLTEADGYYFGRGTIDNKLGVTMLTAAFAELKKQGFVPTRDLIIAFSGDEETGMQTTRALVAKLAPLKPEFALNSDAGGGLIGEDGKPRAFMMQVAEKTYATFELTVRNQGGHSSRPRADNAIYELASALKKVEGYSFPAQSNPVTRAFFAATGAATPGKAGEMMKRFAANPDDAEAQAALASDPAIVGMTRTTCVATMLRGGHAQNALPQTATATVNCRIFPGMPVADVRAKLAEVAGNPAVEVKLLDNPTTSDVSAPRADVTAALKKAVEARYPGLPIVPYMESGGTDGMHFRNAGIPAFAMSEAFMKETDMYAHGLNERLPVASFAPALDHWPTIIRALAGK